MNATARPVMLQYNENVWLLPWGQLLPLPSAFGHATDTPLSPLVHLKP